MRAVQYGVAYTGLCLDALLVAFGVTSGVTIVLALGVIGWLSATLLFLSLEAQR